MVWMKGVLQTETFPKKDEERMLVNCLIQLKVLYLIRKKKKKYKNILKKRGKKDNINIMNISIMKISINGWVVLIFEFWWELPSIRLVKAFNMYVKRVSFLVLQIFSCVLFVCLTWSLSSCCNCKQILGNMIWKYAVQLYMLEFAKSLKH